MTTSRSFEPRDEAASPAFPLWPFALTAYAEQCSRDYAGYLGRLVVADHALDVIAADEALGRDLLTDMSEAWYALFWGPVGAAMAAVDGRVPPAV